MDGMTCPHCVASVTAGLTAIGGLDTVAIDLNAGGASRVTIHSRSDIDGDAIEGRLQTVLIAPHAGYKYIGDNGFTFAWELGAGYATVFGNTVTAGRSTVKAPADSGVQLTSGLFFGWSF